MSIVKYEVNIIVKINMKTINIDNKICDMSPEIKTKVKRQLQFLISKTDYILNHISSECLLNKEWFSKLDYEALKQYNKSTN